MTRLRATRRRRGFTLMEAIAGIVVLSVLAAVSSGILLNAADGYVAASVRAQLQSEASVTLDRVTVLLRNLPRDEDGSGSAADLDRVESDAISWSGNHSIRRADDELILELDSVERTMQNDVVGWLIQSFDESNELIPGVISGPRCDDVQRIELTLTVSRHGVEETLRTRVFLRATLPGGGGV